MAADIQNRLIKLSPYSPGIDFYSGQIVIHVTYNPNWRVLDSYDEAVRIAPDDNGQPTYFYYAPSDTDFNRIFDVIDTTVKFNIEAEAKRQLLIDKINELQGIFETEDLEVLQTLEFKLKKKKGRNTKCKNEVKQVETELKPNEIETVSDAEETNNEEINNKEEKV